MTRIIDARTDSNNKHAVNRRKFLQRFKQKISATVSSIGSQKTISDFSSNEAITIPFKDNTEPCFRYANGPSDTVILPGNQNFIKGDQIPKPEAKTEGTETQASNSPETGEDSFNFAVSRDEFLEIFFDSLELPHLLKKQTGTIKADKPIRGGFSSEGSPSNINVIRTMRNALARRIALKTSNKRPAFIDPVDLTYNRKVMQSNPNLKAVMFCLMDVSGSMDETKKDLAKRFFILLHLFLTRTYDTIEIVFIRHHTAAKEVKEQDFFYSRETGGTVVSSALELMHKIIQERYSTQEWNIYGAQASDGDNWNNDSPQCKNLLMHDILPHAQYFAYLEIMPRHHQSLWEEYCIVQNQCHNFAVQSITNSAEIFPAFQAIFKRDKNLQVQQ